MRGAHLIIGIGALASIEACIHTVRFGDHTGASTPPPPSTTTIAVRSLEDRRGSDPRYLYSKGVDSYFASAPLSAAVQRALEAALQANGLRVIPLDANPELILDGEIDRLSVTQKEAYSVVHLAISLGIVRANSQEPVFAASLSGHAAGRAALEALFPSAVMDATQKLHAAGLGDALVAMNAPPEPDGDAPESADAEEAEEHVVTPSAPEPVIEARTVAAIETVRGFSGANIERLAAYLVGSLSDVTGWDVIYRETCTDEACEPEVHRLAAATKHVTVDITFGGEQCEATATVRDERGTQSVAPVTADCEAEALESAMDELAFEVRSLPDAPPANDVAAAPSSP